MSIQLVGFIGSLLLAFANLPQAIKSFKEKSSKGVSITTVVIGIVGMVFLLIYCCVKLPNEIFLILNYLLNLICLSVILYFGRNK